MARGRRMIRHRVVGGGGFGFGIVVAALWASSVAAQTATAGNGALDGFVASLAKHWGRAYEGRVVANEPKAGPNAPPDPFEGKTLVMHVRRCAENGSRLEVPFHVGADRSRTWVLTRREGKLQLKHDHRHEDGSPDALTMYGGITVGPGTAGRQEFPADEETKALFTRLNLPASIPNVWAMEISESVFVYELRRPGRLFRVAFDLTKPVATPQAPWGHEEVKR